MVLWAHRHVEYLVEKNTNIRAGVHYFISNFVKGLELGAPTLNGPVHTLCKILKNVAASAAECEIAAAFENRQD